MPPSTLLLVVNTERKIEAGLVYARDLLFAPSGAVFVALLVIFWYLATETDDEIAADGKLNVYLLVLFSCLALLPAALRQG